MSSGRPVDVHWTGGLDRTVGQAWSVRVGCPVDVPWMSIGLDRWTGQDSGTSLVSEGGMSSGCPSDKWTGRDSGTSLVSEGGMSSGRPVDVHWTGGLDRTVGQAWSVRVGCPMDVDVPWMSIGQVDWMGQWDKPGQ